MPILRHLHLPNLTPYTHASHLQEILVSRLLRYKASLSNPNSSSIFSAPPPPTILTFTPYPIYTTGRRETSPPSASQLAFLQQPLHTAHHGTYTPDFSISPRGGQITFHGPGQLVIYPVFSLARPYSFSQAPATAPVSHDSSSRSVAPSAMKTSLTPRAYISTLESATIATLAAYGIQGTRTENPGVWMPGGEKKIAAVGVHLRRNVTGYGVGLNVDTDLRWFKRIVACGLVGKEVTSMIEEGGGRGAGEKMGKGMETGEGIDVEEVAGVWVREFARVSELMEGDVVRVKEEEVLAEEDREKG